MTSGVTRARLSILVVLTLSLFAVPAFAQVDYKIVEIDTPTQAKVQQVADMGIDILQVDGDVVIAHVSARDRDKLTSAGLKFRVTIEDPQAFIDEQMEKAGTAAVEYHSYATLNSDLYAMETSGVAKVYNIGSSIEGRDILAVRISDNPDQDEGEPAVLLVGCHHAREHISVEVPYYIALYLVDNYGIDPDVTDWVNSGEIWVVPLLNPDGLEYSQNVYTMWRKNRRNNGGSYGVDLNRNYAKGWGGSGSSGFPFDETYRGTAPFSEPETQALRDHFQNPLYDFKAMITYHSYGELVMYPWGHVDSKAPDHYNLDYMVNEMEDLIDAVHGNNYVAQKGSDLYVASGTTDDWTYDVSGIPSFTIELGKTFIPTPADTKIPEIYEENLPAALLLIDATQNDQDGDGVVEVEDNCMGSANPGQEDDDLDGVGPPCDCDDTNANRSPGLDEKDSYNPGSCSIGIDDDCDGLVDDDDPGCNSGGYLAAANAEASIHGTSTLKGSGLFNELALIFAPIAAILFIRVLRRRT